MTGPGRDGGVVARDLGGGIRVEVHPTRKFKTIAVRVAACSDLDGGVTWRALVPNVLLQGTRRHPTLTDLAARLEDLYGAAFSADVVKVGEWQINELYLEVVNGRYLPDRVSVFRPAVGLLAEVLADPATEGGLLREAAVRGEADKLGRAIEALVNDKVRYARERLFAAMCREEPFGRCEYGRVEDLDGVDAAGLTRFYRRWLAETPVVVQVRGDVDPEQAIETIAEAFRFPRRGERRPSPPPAPVRPREVRQVLERMDIAQAKLCMGYRHDVTYADPRLEAMVVANAILGVSPTSKLFRNVRERESLAYAAHSILERSKGLMIVECGIDAARFQRVVQIARREVDAVARGEVSDEEFESARRLVADRLRVLEDDLAHPLSVAYTWGLHGRPFDLDRYIDRILAVTREGVAEAASRWALDTIYLLAPRDAAGPGEGA